MHKRKHLQNANGVMDLTV